MFKRDYPEIAHAITLRTAKELYLEKGMQLTVTGGGMIDPYDSVGQITGYSIEDGLGSIRSTFTYDPLQQLASESGVKNKEYDYDSLHCPKNAKVSANLQILEDDFTYDYSLNGNRIRKDNATFTYDGLNRLTSATIAGQYYVEYTYDHENRRIRQEESTWNSDTSSWEAETPQDFLYHAFYEIGHSENGVIKSLRILGQGKGAEIGASILLEIDGNVVIPIHDHRGNICQLHDLNGNSIATDRYSAYGEHSNSLQIPWGFSSKRYNPHLNLYNFGLREYDPMQGRWTTTDPAGFVDGPNLYAYVANSPLTYFDLYGLYKKRGTAPVRPDRSIDPERYKKNYKKHCDTKRLDKKGFKQVVKNASLKGDWQATTIEGVQLIAGKILFVNGMLNREKEAIETGRRLQGDSGGVEHTVVYNDSRGPGALKAFFEYFGFKTKEVYNIRAMICQTYLDFLPLREAGYDVSLFIGSHSQGSMQVKLALKGLPRDVQLFVKSQTANGAKVVPAKYCGGARNIQCSRDIVPRLDIFGNRQYKDEITRYKSVPGAALLDHSFDSPTLRDPFQKGVNTFIDDYKILRKI